MQFKCECCDKKCNEEPIYVPSDDGYETFIVCSADCEKLMTTHDPHCSCNACMAEFSERQEQAILEETLLAEIKADFIVSRE